MKNIYTYALKLRLKTNLKNQLSDRRKISNWKKWFKVKFPVHMRLAALTFDELSNINCILGLELMDV